MLLKKHLKTIRLLILLLVAPFGGLLAASESYVQSITGNLKKGDSVTVIDDKFLNLPINDWNQVKNLSIDNVISFELRQDTPLNYYTRPFSCTLNITIKYFTSRDQQIPKEIDNLDLVVRYDTTKGKHFPMIARYKFKNAFKVTVVINSISSPEWKDKLPAVFRLKNQILVERKYPFDGHGKGSLHIGLIQPIQQESQLLARGPQAIAPFQAPSPLQVVNGQLPISWDPAQFAGAEEYDLEWTYIDALSSRGVAIQNSYGGQQGPLDIPDDIVGQWMMHDATRVTITSTQYSISLPYTEGYVLVRVRGVNFPAENIRHTGDWQYRDGNGNTSGLYIDAHQPFLNWQYVGSFAEEGKKKEAIDYFDGSQRDRQTVTITNSDLTSQNGVLSPTASVHEIIYDIMGRAAVNIMPVPVKSSVLDYYPAFNQDGADNPYSFSNIHLDHASGNSCSISADALSNSSGAAQYYSPANGFMDAQQNFPQDASNATNYYFTKYVPDAGGYPFSLTEYTQDNTGRIRRQGGVGSTFQIGSGHETNYFYGKPLQSDLDRLFGSEAGDASHYLKNMIVDPNGQVSVTYIDANGKTIATALTGGAPGNLDALPSSQSAQASRALNETLIQPADFVSDALGLSMNASTTFMATVPGNFTLNYSVAPLALVTQFGTNGANQLCNDCYYTLSVKVTNDCGMLVNSATSTPFQGNDATCYVNPSVVTAQLPLNLPRIGEYTVTYSLQLSDAVINFQTNNYVQNNTDLKTLNNFFVQELQALDLSSCYATCDACKNLGSIGDFTAKVMDLLGDPSQITGLNTGDPAIGQWITTIFNTLKVKCSSLSCAPPSPCEQKLQQMEQDVLPGGQYALYDSNALNTNAATVFLDISPDMTQTYNTNVMVFYQTDPAIANLTVLADNGTTVTVGSLSQADFIRAYLKHPEWASLFVVHDIEYCSYQWCKDASNPAPLFNNEVSYTFDENLKDNFQDGNDAVTAGYYNHSDPYALLNKDPFFSSSGGHGAGYYSAMQSDLQNLSTVLNIVLTDNTVRPPAVFPAKNIIQLVDWDLYCKPADANPSTFEVENSWSNCNPSDGCRSVTMEWQMYLGYYLQLKSRYYQLAKQQYNPSCVNCFIGADPLSANASAAVSSCVANASNPPPVGVCPAASSFTTSQVLVSATPADPVNLPDFTDVIDDVYYIHTGGPVNRPVTFTVTRTTEFAEPVFDSNGDGGWDEVFFFPASTNFTVTLPAGQDRIVIGQNSEIYQSDGPPPTCSGCIENPDGPYFFTQTTYTVVANSVTCAPYAPPPSAPSSSCTSNPNYALYKDKIRVFTDYIDMTDLLTCNAANVPTTSQAQANALAAAEANLTAMEGNWLARLQAVRDAEFPNAGSALSDQVLTSLVQVLYSISDTYLQAAAQSPQTLTMAATSNLPPGMSTPAGYTSFSGAFAAILGGQLVQEGFGPDLLDAPYPYNKLPFPTDPNVYSVNPNICSNLADFNTAWVNAGSPGTFPGWLQQQLGDDYLLTLTQFADLQNRCANISSCTMGYLSNPVILPVALQAPNPSDPLNQAPNPVPPVTAFVTCSQFAALNTSFQQTYPSVTAGTQLYELLYTNYLNHQLGYALSYADYASFGNGQNNQCSLNASALLYDKPQSPSIPNDYFACSADLIMNAWSKSGQEYDLYINQVRVNFRNAYISKCLSNQASAVMQGNQYEYHYTLYYYDQSGNLVKTVPPEGVKLLTDDQVAQVEQNRSTAQINQQFIVPAHGLPTTYQYNSLNQVVQQTTPDAGTSTFLYDRLGRLSISQNAEQLLPAIVDANDPMGRFSYTRYDPLNRIIEVGEKLGAATLSELDTRNDVTLANWYASGSNRQVTLTAYDAVPAWAPSGLIQSNLRKRVAAMALMGLGSDPNGDRRAATYYNYDFEGNVAELIQENQDMMGYEVQNIPSGDPYKHIKYDYDQISGKVNKVSYQDGKWDQFYYQYIYDADNRFVQALTSRDNLIWQREASYRYYLHGPLARTELGDVNNQVQGLDYVYTLQGWLKGMGGQQLTGSNGLQTDISGNGIAGSPFSTVARNVCGYSLGYFNNDYQPIGGSSAPAFGLQYQAPPATPGISSSGKELFNSNIGQATYAINQLESGNTIGYSYRYDQLNRLTAMDRHNITAGASIWDNASIINDYAERISYDANGNIQTYQRNSQTTGSNPNAAMDNLTYNYSRDANGMLLNNKLGNINDAVSGFSTDIHDQEVGNYSYNNIGELTGDQQESIGSIQWTVYGKIAGLTKVIQASGPITIGGGGPPRPIAPPGGAPIAVPGDSPIPIGGGLPILPQSQPSGVESINFQYDPLGNRIGKTVVSLPGTGDNIPTTVKTWYVHDGQGNVLAVYNYNSLTDPNAPNPNMGTVIIGQPNGLTWAEQHLYGSKRLGILTPGLQMAEVSSDAYNPTNDPVENQGNRNYEITNHLGNVIATINDIRNGIPSQTNGSLIDHYEATVLSEQDYYPFGMQMPGRGFSSSAYRYGFNGKENDDEIEGAGNQIDYGARIYDPRTARWQSVDPEFKKGPEFSPYGFDGNNPMSNIDIHGDWPTSVHHEILEGAFGSKSIFAKIVSADQLKQLILGSDRADNPFRGNGLGNQSDANQFVHGMRPRGMSISDAKKAADKWINSKVNEFVKTGDYEKLGEALHTIMDETSPAHRNENGDPLVYNIISDHNSKEDPDDIKKHNGADGYITAKRMNEKLAEARLEVQAKLQEALKKRADYLKQKSNSQLLNSHFYYRTMKKYPWWAG